jgi:Skp family chaperone for outer membrane proteins
LKEDFDKELVEMDNALLEKMKERVRKVLEQFIAATDYCIIMEKQRVAVYCKTVDVTDEIIKRLDSYRE